MANVGPWATGTTSAAVMLDATGGSSGGASCTVALADGVSTQTPTADAGSVGITVEPITCPSTSPTPLPAGHTCYGTTTFKLPTSCGQDGNIVLLVGTSYTATPTSAATYDLNTGLVTSNSNAYFSISVSYRYYYEVYSSHYKGCISRTGAAAQTWSFN